ncbi:MAG: ABC transporter ATP-binding protein [Gammaproteobacteria bacterium]
MTAPHASLATTSRLLSVRDLTVEFATRDGVVPVLDRVSLELEPGETLGVVGESGCGKSMTALAIMGLVPSPPGRIAGGSIDFAGDDLTQASDAHLREVRGNSISMIFQEPMTSLNPVYTIGEQIAEVLRRHQNLARRAAWARAVELLDSVSIPLPARRVHDYPHQLSGGMRQRVMIAIALACKPRILIADEPTTALDVTVQAQIFDLLLALREETGTAIILITHDMGVVAEMADRVIVMYAGRKVEEGPVREILSEPHHPYTLGLIASVPHLTAEVSDEPEDLTEIPGIVPPLVEFGKERCLFAPRCPRVSERCRSERPTLSGVGQHCHVACWHAGAQSEA